MSRPIRVLIIEGNSVTRQLLQEILCEDGTIDVVRAVSHGDQAIPTLSQLGPDVVVLGAESPARAYGHTLTALRHDDPDRPILVFNHLARRGGGPDHDPLAVPGVEFINNPPVSRQVISTIATIRLRLVPRIKHCGRQRVLALPGASIACLSGPTPERSAPVGVVVIGCSTGGPQALASLLGRLPATFPVPVIVVQHMPEAFSRYLVGRLAQQCKLAVCEATDGTAIRAGTIWIVAGDRHLELVRASDTVVAALHEGPPENGCRPSVDVLFRSAAEVYGPRCLGLILTGAGQDGVWGSRHIVDAGGTVWVQDEASSAAWGMPRAVVDAGLASLSAAPAALADALIAEIASTPASPPASKAAPSTTYDDPKPTNLAAATP